MQKITTACSQPLFNTAATRRIELLAASSLAPHTLMQRAGLAVARLSMAISPHAQCIWLACGPGNNGGDGFEAARHLHRWGKHVVVTWTGAGKSGMPPDAQAAYQRAVAAGVTFADQPPVHFDFCIDALLGIGASFSPALGSTKRMLDWLQLMALSPVCLAVDIPSGLNADTGVLATQDVLSEVLTVHEAQIRSRAIILGAARTRTHWATGRFTLSLLTLKPGLFTGDGRDTAGEVWFDDLGVAATAAEPPNAWLIGADSAVEPKRRHLSHKGSFGDVAILGGESTHGSSLRGAALLAASAALHAGAGRVFVALLGDNAPAAGTTKDAANGTTTHAMVNTNQPELMFRSLEALDMRSQVVVCGCGGGQAVKAVLPRVLSTATQLVLDADALNAIANDTSLETLLRARAARGYKSVLTPHPLEAARLLRATTVQVQTNRLAAAAQLAERYQAVVVLKGSGTVVAAPGQTSRVNSSGNALLSTAGTGDVLAGMVGARLAGGADVADVANVAVAFDAACSAVFRHGQLADDWERTHPGQRLTASRLATSI